MFLSPTLTPLPCCCATTPEGKDVGWACVWFGKKRKSDTVGARFTYQAGDLLPRRKVGDGSFWSVRDPRRVLGMGNRKNPGCWW